MIVTIMTGAFLNKGDLTNMSINNKKKTTMQSKKRQDQRTFILFLLPAVLAFVLVVFIPFIQGIYYSFTDWNGLNTGSLSFVGIKNYLDAFVDERFHYSMIVTFVFGTINFLLINIVSFSLALLVSAKLKGKNIYRAGFFLPNLIGGLVLGYIWQFIFSNVITDIPLPFFQNNLFLADPKLAVIALVICSNWQYAGYIMMIYYTALQGVPKELEESAQLDGCTGWQRLWNVTIPIIMPTFTIALFLTLSNSFKQYDVVLSLTNGGPSMLWNGNAINATELLAVNIYKTASVENHMALGQAKAILFFLGLMVLTLIQVSLTRRKEIES